MATFVCYLTLFFVPLVSQAVRTVPTCGQGWNYTSMNYPWMLSMQTRQDEPYEHQHFCAAVLISPTAMLTSAKCARHAQRHSGRVEGGCRISSPGSINEGQRRCDSTSTEQMDFYPHPDSNGLDPYDANDIAIIKQKWQPFRGPNFYVAREWWYNDICIPDSYDSDPQTGSTVHALGWMFAVAQVKQTRFHGLGLSKDINKNTLLVKDRADCPMRENKVYFDMRTFTMKETCESCKDLCLQSQEKGKTAVCAGDEGGPILQHMNGRYHVIGIVTRARPCEVTSDHAATYLNLQPFIPWIKSMVPELQTD
jgi:hypothetical protein